MIANIIVIIDVTVTFKRTEGERERLGDWREERREVRSNRRREGERERGGEGKKKKKGEYNKTQNLTNPRPDLVVLDRLRSQLLEHVGRLIDVLLHGSIVHVRQVLDGVEFVVRILWPRVIHEDQLQSRIRHHTPDGIISNIHQLQANLLIISLAIYSLH